MDRSLTSRWSTCSRMNCWWSRCGVGTKHSVGTFKKSCGIMLVSNIILQNFDCVQNLKQHVLYDPLLKVVGIMIIIIYFNVDGYGRHCRPSITLLSNLSTQCGVFSIRRFALSVLLTTCHWFVSGYRLYIIQLGGSNFLTNGSSTHN